MTEKLPRITAADAIRVLEKAGFSLALAERKTQNIQK